MTSEARKSQTPSLPLCKPVSGRASTVYGMFMIRCNVECRVSFLPLRLPLRREILPRAWNRVLVGSAIRDRLGQEIPVTRRRRRHPLERRRLPGIPIDRLPPLQTGEEVDDEGNLEQAEAPGRE